MGHGLGPGGSGSEGRVMNFIRRYTMVAAAIVAKATTHGDIFFFFSFLWFGRDEIMLSCWNEMKFAETF